MKIESSAFKHNERIPAKFTCEGKNVNPPLKISDVPSQAKSLVLIMDDPDAPMGTWVHWIVWNIDPKTSEISENSVPSKSTQGITSFKSIGYGGPCPPVGHGIHHYFFKLYALDTVLNHPSSSDKRELEEAIKNHILAKAEIIGLYSREK